MQTNVYKVQTILIVLNDNTYTIHNWYDSEYMIVSCIKTLFNLMCMLLELNNVMVKFTSVLLIQ